MVIVFSNLSLQHSQSMNGAVVPAPRTKSAHIFFPPAAQRREFCFWRGRRKDYMEDYSEFILHTNDPGEVSRVRQETMKSPQCVCSCFNRQTGKGTLKWRRSSEFSGLELLLLPVSPRKRRIQQRKTGDKLCARCRGFQRLVSESLLQIKSGYLPHF